jgi:hypothetical protein
MVGYYDDSSTDEPEQVLRLELDVGEYFIRVEEFWDAGGSYELEVVLSGEGADASDNGDGGGDWTEMGALEVGEVVESTLDSEQRHAWVFTAQSGDVFDIAVVPIDPEMDMAFSVIAPNGSPLVPQYDEGFTGEAEELFGLQIEWSGGYTIIVEEFWGEAGSYELWIAPSTEANGEGNVLEVGSLAYGEFGEFTLPAGENVYHLWSFEGASGDVITVIVAPMSADADLMLGLVDPDGNVLLELVDETSSDESEQISGYELPVTGTYSIVITEYWDEYAEYKLTLELD